MAFSILIVDDSPAMRLFIRRVIDLSGFEVIDCLEAADGLEAMEELRKRWVDVVLTDINMPNMNGEELVREMSAHEVLKTIPVVVISTDSTESRIERLMALGARGYVRKPFLPETLREELERVMEAANA
jgi:two-component system chemotaxis response regulator CheY